MEPCAAFIFGEEDEAMNLFWVWREMCEDEDPQFLWLVLAMKKNWNLIKRIAL